MPESKLKAALKRVPPFLLPVPHYMAIYYRTFHSIMVSFLSMGRGRGCVKFQRNTQLTEKREKRIFGWHKDKVGGRKIATVESPGHPEARSQGAACGQQAPGCKVSVVQP